MRETLSVMVLAMSSGSSTRSVAKSVKASATSGATSHRQALP